MKKKNDKSEASILRQKAEEKLKKRLPDTRSTLSEHDTLILLHELEVHQIELEMQNEELLLAIEQAEAATDRYIELYDFAPNGYFTLSREGRIIKLNLLGAQILGKERSRLLNKNFSLFVSADTRGVFNLFLEKVFQFKTRESCEVIMTPGTDLTIHVQLTGVINENEDHLLITADDITDKKHADDILSRSESRFRNLVQDMHVGVLLQGPGSEILLSNPQALELLGLTQDQLAGKTSFDPDWNVIHEDGTPFPGPSHPVPQAISTGRPVRDIIMGVYRPSKDDRVWLLVDAIPQLSDNGKVLQVVCTFIEITERILAEEKIKSLLAQKTIRLKEVHHRIKNNMNTIQGLLTLQADSAENTEIKDALNDAKCRVQSMSMLYDKLYRKKDFKVMSTKEYLPALISEIIGNFPNCSIVKTEIHIDDFILDTQTIVTVGIIVNELITNMMKYAFKGKENCLIAISALAKDTHVIISVHDDGIGIPEVINFENSAGFGMKLVSMLTEQLGGTIRIERNNGTGFILEFDL